MWSNTKLGIPVHWHNNVLSQSTKMRNFLRSQVDSFSPWNYIARYYCSVPHVHPNFFYSAAESECTPLPRAPILDMWNKYSVLEKMPNQRSWLLLMDLMLINWRQFCCLFFCFSVSVMWEHNQESFNDKTGQLK